MITSRTWAGKHYAVLGLARSGAAVVRSLLASGAEVVAWDSDETKREDVLLRKQELCSPAPQPASPGLLPSQEHMSLADPLTVDLTDFAAVVVSPGVPLNTHPIAAHAAKFGVPVIGDIELFAQARAELPPHKVVGITGTNGKSTTTALVHHILKTAGVPTMMGGNIGLPIFAQEPLPEGGVYVLELSSFQIDLTFSLDCDVAVLLNITPDHLDRYASFEAYAASKARLLAMSSHPPIDLRLPGEGRGPTRSSATDILMSTDRLGPGLRRGDGGWPNLQGPHNAQNATAAVLVCRALALDDVAIDAGLKTYSGLPHRMEVVRTTDGVTFVNDSKATNATSAAPALAAFPAIRWILGGKAKTNELDACVPHFGHVRSAYTIGEAGPMFAALLRPHMPVEESGTLARAVTSTARDALPGDTVLLSPACASYDQFRDFEHRGDTFRRLVEAL